MANKVHEVGDLKDVDMSEHSEDISPEQAAALAIGAKGSSKSADVAMKLFQDHDINMEIDPADTKRVVRKVDWIIVPMIAVNYVFFYIDKTTLRFVLFAFLIMLPPSQSLHVPRLHNIAH